MTIHTVFILEDITSGVSRTLDYQAPGGMSVIAECTFMGQRLGIGIIFCCHSLSGLSYMIRDNIECWLCFSQSGQDPRIISHTLGTTPEQSDYAKQLQPGSFILSNPGLYEHPVLGFFDRVSIPQKLPEDQRRQQVERFLSQVKTKPPYRRPVPQPVSQSQPVQAKQPKMQLTDANWKFLITLAMGLPAPVTEMYKRLNLSAGQGRRLVLQLEKLGLIHCYPLSTGRRGGAISLPVVTDLGWTLLQDKNIKRPAALTNGGLLHEAAAVLIQAYGKALSCKVMTEPAFKGFRADLLFCHSQSSVKEIINIGLSDPVREADNMARFMALACASQYTFTFVAADGKFHQAVKNHLAKIPDTNQFLNRITFKLIADYLKGN